MSKLQPIDWLVAGLVLLVPAFLLLVQSWDGVNKGMSSTAAQAWAAWVQAIGSIAAIGAAAWIAGRQSRQALVTEQRRASESIDALARILVGLNDAARGSIPRGGQSVEKYLDEFPDGRRFLVLRNTIMRIPLESLRNEAAVQTIGETQADLSTLTTQREGRELIEQMTHDRYRVEFFVREVEQRILLLRAEALRLLDGRGSRHSAAA